MEKNEAERQVLAAFAEYWRAHYHDGCIISNREWHLPKLQAAIKYALRESFKEAPDA